jgi:hypothetical protein
MKRQSKRESFRETHGKTFWWLASNHTVGRHGIHLMPVDVAGRRIGQICVTERQFYIRGYNSRRWRRMSWDRLFEILIG